MKKRVNVTLDEKAIIMLDELVKMKFGDKKHKQGAAISVAISRLYKDTKYLKARYEREKAKSSTNKGEK